jgi:hypothetical protein
MELHRRNRDRVNGIFHPKKKTFRAAHRLSVKLRFRARFSDESINEIYDPVRYLKWHRPTLRVKEVNSHRRSQLHRVTRL